MSRKLLGFILLIFLIIAGVGALLYLAVKKQRQSSTPVKTSKLLKVYDETVVSPTGSSDNKTIWFFNLEGRLFSIKSDGTKLSEFPLPEMEKNEFKFALWPKTGSDFIIFAQDNKQYYSSSLKQFVALPSGIKYLDWMPDGKRIVYVWQAGDGKVSLNLADADASGYRKIKDLFYSDLAIKISPDGKQVALWRQIPGGNKIYLLNLENAEMSTAVEQGETTGLIWVSDNRFIFAKGKNSASRLFLYDSTIKQTTDLGLNVTLDKIAVNAGGNFLVAAVPNSANNGDEFVKVDLKNLKKETYFQPTQSLRAQNLFLLGQSAYFSNIRDGKFYLIDK